MKQIKVDDEVHQVLKVKTAKKGHKTINNLLRELLKLKLKKA